MPSVLCSVPIASFPVSAEKHFHLVALEHARHREDVPHVVIHDQHLLAREDRIRIMQALQNLAFLFRQTRRVAVQPKRRLIEEAFRTAHVFHDRGLRDAVELLLLFAREVLAGVNDDRADADARRESCRSARSPTCPAASDRAPRNRSCCSLQLIERFSCASRHPSAGRFRFRSIRECCCAGSRRLRSRAAFFASVCVHLADLGRRFPPRLTRATGLVRKRSAPCLSAFSGSSLAEMMKTGMCRVRRSSSGGRAPSSR